MTKQLFIGGPKHGEYIEVPDDRRTFQMFAALPALTIETATAWRDAHEVHTYLRRDFTAVQEHPLSHAVTRYERAVFVHDGIASPDLANQLLAEVLILAWLAETAVREVTDGEVVSSGEQ